MSVDPAKEREFILRLEALTREFGISIGGCGCCGSPSLDPATTEPEAGYAYNTHLQWVAPSDEYDWKNYSHQIVRPE